MRSVGLPPDNGDQIVAEVRDPGSNPGACEPRWSDYRNRRCSSGLPGNPSGGNGTSGSPRGRPGHGDVLLPLGTERHERSRSSSAGTARYGHHPAMMAPADLPACRVRHLRPQGQRAHLSPPLRSVSGHGSGLLVILQRPRTDPVSSRIRSPCGASSAAHSTSITLIAPWARFLRTPVLPDSGAICPSTRLVRVR